MINGNELALLCYRLKIRVELHAFGVCFRSWWTPVDRFYKHDARRDRLCLPLALPLALPVALPPVLPLPWLLPPEDALDDVGLGALPVLDFLLLLLLLFFGFSS